MMYDDKSSNISINIKMDILLFNEKEFNKCNLPGLGHVFGNLEVSHPSNEMLVNNQSQAGHFDNS